MTRRWPHISRFLLVEPSGQIRDRFDRWWFAEEKLSAEERAAGNAEWADFYEFRLAQRAEELAGDDGRRGFVEEWTDSMAYCLRRCAAIARGEDPGPWIPQEQRRPDLAAAKQARVERILAERDEEREPVRHMRTAG